MKVRDIKGFKDSCVDLVEKSFPKGQCKERGAALVLHAEMIIRIGNLKLSKLEELEKSKLTKEEFYVIACEYRPSIAEDSQQPEWTREELDKLWEGLTKGHWLYINRDKQIQELQQKLEEAEKFIAATKRIQDRSNEGA